MPRARASTTTRSRHKRVLKRAKGYFSARSRIFKTAKEAVQHAGQYAYRDRRNKKRDFRRLWITRINAAARMEGMSYSRFMQGLNQAGIEIDRKMLAELAVNDMDAFKTLVVSAKSALGEA